MKSIPFFCFLGFLGLGLVSCQKDRWTANSLEELESKLEKEFNRNNLSSIAYCIVKNDELIYANAMGLADKANNKPATENTRYLIASVSKTVTALALMQLVEQNLIGLDDDVANFLPFALRNHHFPNRPITYRMLLSHYSSISDDTYEGLELDCFGRDCEMSLAAFFNNIFSPSGQFYSLDHFKNVEPSTRQDYSNLGSALAGYLVERITQTPFDVYCRDNIFVPLGMNKTEWRLANIPLDELALPYSNELSASNPHYTFPDYPNGGLRASAVDLSKLLRMVIGGGSLGQVRILSPETVGLMKSFPFGGSEYSLGFHTKTVHGRSLLGHSGGEKGVTAEMFFDASTNIGVIILNNDDDANLDNLLALLFSYGESR